tara:strand:- start:6318 stop:8936 length:2619 start_codon:yes stop_codon:yes gene_type:complete
MIKEILFIHHSHTDIGYTHPQPVVLELHLRFIDQALDLVDRYADYPDDARFRWTCEVTGITRAWWEQASARDRDRFMAAIARGQIDVAGMLWHMTPLMDHSMPIDGLANLAMLRGEGMPIRYAMNTDVNGTPWGMVDVLLDHGIEGLSMSINEHYGHALRPWPRAFNWQSPSGRSIAAYNGFIYGATSDRMLSIPLDMDATARLLPAWAKRWEESGYPHPFLMHQLTNVSYLDNAAPQPRLPDFVRRFNETVAPQIGIKLRIGTLTEFFDRMRREPADTLPTLRGDWTDWWNFGAGSSAQETAQSQRGQRDLDLAINLHAWHGPGTVQRWHQLAAAAKKSLALYAEHTWGADRSINQPYSQETRTQQLLKLATAAEGASYARMLRRDGLESLARHAGGEAPHLLVYNPHPVPVRQALSLSNIAPFGAAATDVAPGSLRDFLPFGPPSHLVHRQDVDNDVPTERRFWTRPFEVPALSYVVVPAEEVMAGPMDGLSVADNVLSNGRIAVTIDPDRGGLAGLDRDGRNFVGAHTNGLRFGVPVLETIASNDREDMFRSHKGDRPDWSHYWNRDWPAAHMQPDRPVWTRERLAHGCAEIVQLFELANGDTIEVLYRLTADDPALQIEATIMKTPIPGPHAIYLPMPAALDPDWDVDYETAGAAVRLDDEQLPYASRHYVTTQRFIRISDAERELTVATPDAPLWQIGGFTYGRFRAEDGTVERPHPVLLAWLTNNYWSTNFQADQGGRIHFGFWIIPHGKRELGIAAAEALSRAQPLAHHLYAGHGALTNPTDGLLSIDADSLVLTRMETVPEGVALTVLNLDNDAHELRIGAGRVTPVAAQRTNLAGAVIETLACDGSVRMPVAGRAWARLVVHI